MLNSLPWFIGLRYVRARSHKFFVSFITWVSLLCVCLGVTALIVDPVGDERPRNRHARSPAGAVRARTGVRPRRIDCRAGLAATRGHGATRSQRGWRLALSGDRGAVGAQARDVAGEAARHRSHARGRRGARGAFHRRRKTRGPGARLGSRHRRRRLRADARARRRRHHHRAGAHHRCQRRARSAPARIPGGGHVRRRRAGLRQCPADRRARRRARPAAEPRRAHGAARELPRAARRGAVLRAARRHPARRRGSA